MKGGLDIKKGFLFQQLVSKNLSPITKKDYDVLLTSRSIESILFKMCFVENDQAFLKALIDRFGIDGIASWRGGTLLHTPEYVLRVLSVLTNTLYSTPEDVANSDALFTDTRALDIALFSDIIRPLLVSSIRFLASLVGVTCTDTTTCFQTYIDTFLSNPETLHIIENYWIDSIITQADYIAKFVAAKAGLDPSQMTIANFFSNTTATDYLLAHPQYLSLFDRNLDAAQAFVDSTFSQTVAATPSAFKMLGALTQAKIIARAVGIDPATITAPSDLFSSIDLILSNPDTLNMLSGAVELMRHMGGSQAVADAIVASPEVDKIFADRDVLAAFVENEPGWMAAVRTPVLVQQDSHWLALASAVGLIAATVENTVAQAPQPTDLKIATLFTVSARAWKEWAGKYPSIAFNHPYVKIFDPNHLPLPNYVQKRWWNGTFSFYFLGYSNTQNMLLWPVDSWVIGFDLTTKQWQELFAIPGPITTLAVKGDRIFIGTVDKLLVYDINGNLLYSISTPTPQAIYANPFENSIAVVHSGGAVGYDVTAEPVVQSSVTSSGVPYNAETAVVNGQIYLRIGSTLLYSGGSSSYYSNLRITPNGLQHAPGHGVRVESIFDEFGNLLYDVYVNYNSVAAYNADGTIAWSQTMPQMVEMKVVGSDIWALTNTRLMRLDPATGSIVEEYLGGFVVKGEDGYYYRVVDDRIIQATDITTTQVTKTISFPAPLTIFEALARPGGGVVVLTNEGLKFYDSTLTQVGEVTGSMYLLSRSKDYVLASTSNAMIVCDATGNVVKTISPTASIHGRFTDNIIFYNDYSAEQNVFFDVDQNIEIKTNDLGIHDYYKAFVSLTTGEWLVAAVLPVNAIYKVTPDTEPQVYRILDGASWATLSAPWDIPMGAYYRSSNTPFPQKWYVDASINTSPLFFDESRLAIPLDNTKLLIKFGNLLLRPHTDLTK